MVTVHAPRLPLLVALLAAITCWLAPARVLADEGEAADTGWRSTAEVSFVQVSGNSESTTLGFNGSARRKWDKALLQLKLGALEVKSTANLGVAVGEPDDFTVPELTQTTAENYYVVGRYDHNITDTLVWYVAAGWLRNEFAGIKNRYVVSCGAGNVWFDSETFSLRSNYGISYTDQRDLVDLPLVKSSFAGVLLSSNLRKKLGKGKSEYGNDFVFNYSLADSDNWRWTMDQWATTSLTEKLALKVALKWSFNNVPALEELTLLEGDPPEDLGNKVTASLDELDTIFSVALVLTF
ncbi:MAG: DUF481 domain-containing protein [bacterium]|nr:DUF481 domain-containing protein [bacterium]